MSEPSAGTPVTSFSKELLGTTGVLYVAGMFVSVTYFARYNILALDMLRPICILIGVEVALLYGIPVSLLAWYLSSPTRTRTQLIPVWSIIAIVSIIPQATLRGLSWAALLGVTTGVLVQALPFAAWRALKRSRTSRVPGPGLASIPGKWVLAACGVLCCLHFSLFTFPYLGVSWGGGKPYFVQVYPKTADLLASRFNMSKNRPKINPSIDSFRLRLLYESSKDFYFLEERRSDAGREGFSAMRVPKDEILRIDYVTAQWRGFGGREK